MADIIIDNMYNPPEHPLPNIFYETLAHSLLPEHTGKINISSDEKCSFPNKGSLTVILTGDAMSDSMRQMAAGSFQAEPWPWNTVAIIDGSRIPEDTAIKILQACGKKADMEASESRGLPGSMEGKPQKYVITTELMRLYDTFPEDPEKALELLITDIKKIQCLQEKDLEDIQEWFHILVPEGKTARSAIDHARETILEYYKDRVRIILPYGDEPLMFSIGKNLKSVPTDTLDNHVRQIRKLESLLEKLPGLQKLDEEEKNDPDTLLGALIDTITEILEKQVPENPWKNMEHTGTPPETDITPPAPNLLYVIDDEGLYGPDIWSTEELACLLDIPVHAGIRILRTSAINPESGYMYGNRVPAHARIYPTHRDSLSDTAESLAAYLKMQGCKCNIQPVPQFRKQGLRLIASRLKNQELISHEQMTAGLDKAFRCTQESKRYTLSLEEAAWAFLGKLRYFTIKERKSGHTATHIIKATGRPDKHETVNFLAAKAGTGSDYRSYSGLKEITREEAIREVTEKMLEGFPILFPEQT